MSTVDNLIHAIAVRTDINEAICHEAAMEVAQFYAPNRQPEEIINMLYLYLADGQEMRAVVHQFRQIVARLEKAQDEQRTV